MNAPNDNTAPKGLRVVAGMSPAIRHATHNHPTGVPPPPRLRARGHCRWYRPGRPWRCHPRGGSFTTQAAWWTAFWLVLAAAQFATAYWYLAIARSASART